MGRRIEIDPNAGVCYGVEKAIDTAEQKLREGVPVYGLGDMVHNDQETDRLRRLGLTTIQREDFRRIGPAKVILRAHGEPPATYKEAKENQIEIIDATCPIVIALQKKIRKRYETLDKEREQIVIFGKADHPETIGLMGQTNDEAVLVTDPFHLDHIDPDRKIFLYAQTTMDPEQFSQLEKNIEEMAIQSSSEKPGIHCTICSQMKRRKPDLKKFAESHDYILFLSGRNSSNGAMLYQYSKKYNSRTYWIHDVKDIDPEWFSDEGSIGISGATSTPLWQLEQTREYLVSLIID